MILEPLPALLHFLGRMLLCRLSGVAHWNEFTKQEHPVVHRDFKVLCLFRAAEGEA